MRTSYLILLIVAVTGFSAAILNSTYRIGHAFGVADEHAAIEQLHMQSAAKEQPPSPDYCDSVEWRTEGCRWYAAGVVSEFRKMQKMKGH